MGCVIKDNIACPICGGRSKARISEQFRFWFELSGSARSLIKLYPSQDRYIDKNLKTAHRVYRYGDFSRTYILAAGKSTPKCLAMVDAKTFVLRI